MRMLLAALLLLLCCCSSEFAYSLPLRRNIIKVRASGFLPFESDLLLPLGILRQLQAQDRASRLLPPHHIKPARWKPKPKPKPKQQVRLERAQTDPGIQMYNLIDDDGQLLLNLRVHTDSPDALPLASRLEEQQSAPWRPSKWRPTTNSPLPLGITSSSPRPLPLHQYLTSNSLEQSSALSPSQSASTQQRRMFGARQDWRHL